jgi:hypothetical protein
LNEEFARAEVEKPFCEERKPTEGRIEGGRVKVQINRTHSEGIPVVHEHYIVDVDVTCTGKKNKQIIMVIC